MSTTPTNDDRALWAMQAMMKFARVTKMDIAGEDEETILSDLIADLMHMARLKEINWDEVYNRAISNFEVELAEEGANSAAYDEGHMAYCEGSDRNQNPYPESSDAFGEWSAGYSDANDDRCSLGGDQEDEHRND